MSRPRSTSSSAPLRVGDLAALRDALHRAMREESAQSSLFGQTVAERLGISGSDLDGLDVINLHGPLTAGKLATATGLTTGAITGLIDRLERAGLAQRERDEQDRRKVMVALAPKAFRRIAPLFEGRRRAMAALLSQYTRAELQLLIDFFTRSHRIAVTETTVLRAGDVRAAARGEARKATAAKRAPA